MIPIQSNINGCKAPLPRWLHSAQLNALVVREFWRGPWKNRSNGNGNEIEKQMICGLDNNLETNNNEDK